MATTDYTQNDTAQACALNNYCSGVGGTIEFGRQAEIGAGAGSTEQTFTCAVSQADDNEWSFEVIIPTDVVNPTDTTDAIINVNFTTGQMDLDWDSVFICRVNSSCVNQETIGSATGLGITTNAGLQSTTVGMSAVTFAAGDKCIITLGISNANTMFTRDAGITPDQVLALPFNQPAAAGGVFKVIGDGGIASPEGLIIGQGGIIT